MSAAGTHAHPAWLSPLALAAVASILLTPATLAKETLGYEIEPVARPAAETARSQAASPADSSPGNVPRSHISPISMKDLIRLIEQGVPSSVIVRQVERSGIAFEPGVEEILLLNRTGATDEILEAIQITADEDSAGSGPSASSRRERTLRRSDRSPADVLRSSDAYGAESIAKPFKEEPRNYRIIRGRDGHGRRTVVLTNLDEAGRRIGGEVPYPKHPNVISPAVRPSGFYPALPDVRREPAYRSGESDYSEDTGYERRGRRRERSDSEKSDHAPTVIVVQPPQPPPQPRPAYAPAYYPHGFHSTGGIVGPYRYPDKLWFLGYTPDGGPVRSPAPTGSPHSPK